MVALKSPRAPRPSCDRYGHPVCADPNNGQCEQLRSYLESHETEVAGRWRALYRQLYHDGSHHVPDDCLVDAVQATLRELERVASSESGQGQLQGDDERRHLLKQVCLTGFECHNRLIPEGAWGDQRTRQEVREQLRRRLFCLVKDLVN